MFLKRILLELKLQIVWNYRTDITLKEQGKREKAADTVVSNSCDCNTSVMARNERKEPSRRQLSATKLINVCGCCTTQLNKKQWNYSFFLLQLHIIIGEISYSCCRFPIITKCLKEVVGDYLLSLFFFFLQIFTFGFLLSYSEGVMKAVGT